MSADLKVVPLFDKAVASDVIGSLRRAADTIETETEEDDRTVATFHAMGALAAGISEISPS